MRRNIPDPARMAIITRAELLSPYDASQRREQAYAGGGRGAGVRFRSSRVDVRQRRNARSTSSSNSNGSIPCGNRGYNTRSSRKQRCRRPIVAVAIVMAIVAAAKQNTSSRSRGTSSSSSSSTALVVRRRVRVCQIEASENVVRGGYTNWTLKCCGGVLGTNVPEWHVVAASLVSIAKLGEVQAAAAIAVVDVVTVLVEVVVLTECQPPANHQCRQERKQPVDETGAHHNAIQSSEHCEGKEEERKKGEKGGGCLLYTSPSPRD